MSENIYEKRKWQNWKKINFGAYLFSKSTFFILITFKRELENYVEWKDNFLKQIFEYAIRVAT